VIYPAQFFQETPGLCHPQTTGGRVRHSVRRRLPIQVFSGQRTVPPCQIVGEPFSKSRSRPNSNNSDRTADFILAFAKIEAIFGPS
jgi:hypothetical protein